MTGYRYFARRMPGTERPSVWVGEVDGPNVALIREHQHMLLAGVHAFWLNLWRRRAG